MPTVLRVRPALPRPGFFEAGFLTAGFAAVLFGTLILIAVGGLAVVALRDELASLTAPPDAKPNSVSALPPSIATLLAWSFPLGYLAGFVFTVIVFRVVAKRGWALEIGLGRLPPVHLGLALLVLPAFVILSDGLAQLLFRLFRMEHLLDQSGDLGELFRDFHPAFVFVAIGVGPGVVEELWCRGFLGRGLVGRYGWLKGVTLSSLFFGLLHLYPPPYVLVTAAMGACLHFAYACSRSLWVPIVIHTINNGFAGLAAVGAVPTGGMERAVAGAPALVFPLAAAVLATCGWAAWTARAVADGPRGVMEPPSGVVDRWPSPVAGALALLTAGALAAVLATS
ncbi:MAG TPA: CPBP family intramembrane glutamic endopeptidase [Urbifossiella sp.]|nr:CPBP family intramembrane glutamic endopeptidase [Urbifossiella sp.]